MPEDRVTCTYRIIPDLRLIWNRYPVHSLRRDITLMVQTMRSDAAFDPAYAVLQDMRLTRSDDLTFMDMVALTSEMAAFRRAVPAPLVCAFAAPDDVAFGMARMFQSLMADCPGARIAVTRSMAQAAAFLDLPEPAVARFDIAAVPQPRDTGLTPRHD